jgi:hypothetical protein
LVRARKELNADHCAATLEKGDVSPGITQFANPLPNSDLPKSA